MTQQPLRSDVERKAQVQDYFSRNAEGYVASFSHRAGDDLRRLIEVGEWEQSQQALDIATGGGHTALALAPRVGHITITDLTPRMLEKAREYIVSQKVTNASFVIADAEVLPFLDNSFERITCRIAPHHFSDIARAVCEAARVLKPGGLFLLIDCMAPSDPELDRFDNTVEKWRDASHGRSCTPEEWHTFFTQAGLLIEHSQFFRHILEYDDWTHRSQLPATEKAALEEYILQSSTRIQQYFEVTRKPDGHLASLSNDFIFLKGRKK